VPPPATILRRRTMSAEVPPHVRSAANGGRGQCARSCPRPPAVGTSVRSRSQQRRWRHAGGLPSLVPTPAYSPGGGPRRGRKHHTPESRSASGGSSTASVPAGAIGTIGVIVDDVVGRQTA